MAELAAFSGVSDVRIALWEVYLLIVGTQALDTVAGEGGHNLLLALGVQAEGLPAAWNLATSEEESEGADDDEHDTLGEED